MGIIIQHRPCAWCLTVEKLSQDTESIARPFFACFSEIRVIIGGNHAQLFSHTWYLSLLFFYTNAVRVPKLLHPKVGKFATKVVFWENSGNQQVDQDDRVLWWLLYKRSPTPWVTNISNVLSLRQPSQSSCATIWPFICQAKLVLLINYCLRSTLPGSRVSRTRFNVGRRAHNHL